MFAGQYAHSLDDKNRLVLPSRFRSQLSAVVYVYLDLDSCLSVCSEQQYGQKAERIASLSDYERDSRAFKRIFFANSSESALDKLGRISIPKFLLEKAQIKRDVVIIGAFDHIQLFGAEVIDSKLPNEEKNYEQLAEAVREDERHAV